MSMTLERFMVAYNGENIIGQECEMFSALVAPLVEQRVIC
jgi:hypothetical protein